MEVGEEERLLELLKWATEGGLSDGGNSKSSSSSCLGHSLAVTHFPDAGGRGLGAVRDIRKGELLLRVPRSALITKSSLLESDCTLSAAVNAYPSFSATQLFAVCLLYEVGKGKGSPWYPYFCTFPRSYDLLCTFTDFQIQALQVDDAIWTTERALSKVKLEWNEAMPLMKQLQLKPQLLTLGAWMWAFGTISSRTLHVPWDEAGCLCPIGDLFNYAAPGEESNDVCLSNGQVVADLVVEQSDASSQSLTDGGFNEDMAAYCLYARRNYRKGEQVLLGYGTYTNLELLEHYGFILNENPNDKVFIPLEPDMHSFTSWPKGSMYIHHNGMPSFALMCALRLWATPPNLRRAIGHVAYTGSQLSIQNEISVMKWILKTCCKILSNLPTTIEEDRNLLSRIEEVQNLHDPKELRKVISEFGGEVLLGTCILQNDKNGSASLLCKNKRLVDRWKLAVLWRSNYKKILVDCISYCSKITNTLSSENVMNTRTKYGADLRQLDFN